MVNRRPDYERGIHCSFGPRWTIGGGSSFWESAVAYTCNRRTKVEDDKKERMVALLKEEKGAYKCTKKGNLSLSLNNGSNVGLKGREDEANGLITKDNGLCTLEIGVVEGAKYFFLWRGFSFSYPRPLNMASLISSWGCGRIVNGCEEELLGCFYFFKSKDKATSDLEWGIFFWAIQPSTHPGSSIGNLEQWNVARSFPQLVKRLGEISHFKLRCLTRICIARWINSRRHTPTSNSSSIFDF